jgi:hypothetical protein
MSLLPKLGCPDLGLCLLMQQENVEISIILQAECGPGQQIKAEDAMAMSNLSVAKESTCMSPLMSKDSSSLRGSISSLSSPFKDTAPPVSSLILIIIF